MLEQFKGSILVILEGWRTETPPRRPSVQRTLKIVSYILAFAYFLVDALFVSVARPISRWLAHHLRLERLRAWIRSLSPYPSLALFSVPVIVLEPVKPVAAYLAATGQFLAAAATFIIGELLKLVLIERLFALTRDKLMRIPAFAWAYAYYKQAIGWLKSTAAWQSIIALKRSIAEHVRMWRARAFQHWAIQRGR
jgi:hypothetical protein